MVCDSKTIKLGLWRNKSLQVLFIYESFSRYFCDQLPHYDEILTPWMDKLKIWMPLFRNDVISTAAGTETSA